MSQKRKILLISLVAVPLAAVLAALLWPKAPAAPPQIITVPNGAVYQLAGVTFGTDHVLGTFAARTIYQLPAPVKMFVRKILGTRFPAIQGARTTPQPALVVWFKVTSTSSLPPTGTSTAPGPANPIVARLADENGVESGAQITVMYAGGVLARSVEFPVLPRRSRTLQIRFYESDIKTQKILGEIGSFKFPNPVYGKFPQWTPDTGPLVRKAGDLEVQLDNFFVGKRRAPIWLGNGQQAYNYDPVQNGERAETVFDTSLSSPGGKGANSPWLLQNAVLSDATGNALDNSLISMSADSDGRSTGLSPLPGLGNTRRSLPAALWPDETTWKLRLDLKRTNGFDTNELVTFRQVPVPAIGATNKPGLRHRAGDTQVVLAEFSRSRAATDAELEDFKVGRAPMPGNRMAPTILRFEITGRRDGLAVDFVRLTTATPGSRDEAPAKSDDEPRLAYNQWQPGVRVIGLSVLSTNAKTVDITISVQKTRSVEFLLKPPAVVSQ